MRTRLEVPFEEKERAKALGAIWSASDKAWICPDGVDLMKFSRWLPPELAKWKGTGRRSTMARNRQYKGPTVDYDNRKREWVARNPAATPEEYQAAMREIARKAGV